MDSLVLCVCRCCVYLCALETKFILILLFFNKFSFHKNQDKKFVIDAIALLEPPIAEYAPFYFVFVFKLILFGQSH